MPKIKPGVTFLPDTLMICINRFYSKAKFSNIPARPRHQRWRSTDALLSPSRLSLRCIWCFKFCFPGSHAWPSDWSLCGSQISSCKSESLVGPHRGTDQETFYLLCQSSAKCRNREHSDFTGQNTWWAQGKHSDWTKWMAKDNTSLTEFTETQKNEVYPF